jgi:syntaxin 18
VKHRRDYVDLHRTTEQERDTIEHEVSYMSPLQFVVDVLLFFL